MIKHNKSLWGLAAGIGVLTLASTTTALAAGGGHQADGSPVASAAAPPAPVLTTCLNNLGSYVLTQKAATSMSSTSFVAVPGAAVTFTVPAGKTRCVKVLFTAETACTPSAAVDACYVRVQDNGVNLNPSGEGYQTIDSEKADAQAHAFEWVGRVNEGSHTITIQQKVGNVATSFYLDDWTFDVGIYN